MRINICKDVIKFCIFLGDDVMEEHQLDRLDVSVNVVAPNSGFSTKTHDFEIIEDQNIEISLDENVNPIVLEMDDYDLGRC